jgi:hypothetical protein
VLAINPRAAKAIGLDIRSRLLIRADEGDRVRFANARSWHSCGMP